MSDKVDFLEDEEPNYPDAIDGDIYLNPSFGDLWIVDSNTFVKINDGYTMDLDDTYDFIKVGHVDGVINVQITETYDASSIQRGWTIMDGRTDVFATDVEYLHPLPVVEVPLDCSELSSLL